MKRIISLCAGIILLGNLCLSAQNLENTHYIEVIGKAEMQIAPDEIYLSIKINENDYGKNQDLSTLEKNMLQQLQMHNIDIAKNLSVKDLGSNFKKNVLRKDEVKLSKQYELKTNSAQQAAQVILLLENIGISQVDISKVDCSKMDEYQDELRVSAIKDAQRRANMLSHALKQKCGKAIYICEQDYGNRRVFSSLPMLKRNVATAESSDALPAIEFEKLNLQSSVLVRFSLD